MRQPVEWHSEFAAALLDPALPVPAGVVGPNRVRSAKRFAVYRNNIVAGLIATLKDAFPAACRIVGADFFEAMARIYVVRQPPRSPVLLEYGSGFSAFVAGFEPVARLPYLSDVCRVERAWLEAYHAPEALPLELWDLATLSPDQIHGLRLQLHPSVRLIRSPFPVLTIWKTNIEGGIPVAVELVDNPEAVLVARPWTDVEARSLSAAAMHFIEALAQGSTILTATKAAIRSDHTFEVTTALAGLISLGIFAQLSR